MKKVYVEVNARFTPEGRIVPLSFRWEDGRLFDIDRIIDIRKAASLKAGGIGLRYTVMVKGRQTYMWLEDNQNKWFLEGKDC
jgi:hypothetical protein